MNAGQRQRLFNYMAEQHGLTLLESDMDEIENIVNPIEYPFFYHRGNIEKPEPLLPIGEYTPKLTEEVKALIAKRVMPEIILTPIQGIPITAEHLSKKIQEQFQETTRKYLGFRPDPKPEKVEKKKKPYKFKKKPTGEAKIFEEIWNERPHVSQISGEPIHEPMPINFLHVLAKGQNKYPKFILNKQNIILGTDAEHHIWDNARHLISKKNDETKYYNWKMMLELEESLKQQYKEKYG